MRLGTTSKKICYCSFDTELIRRNHCADKQLDGFMATVEVYWHETLDDRVGLSHWTLNFLEVAQHCDSLEFCPLEFGRHTVDEMVILEVIYFRISFKILILQVTVRSSTISYTEHRSVI